MLDARQIALADSAQQVYVDVHSEKPYVGLFRVPRGACIAKASILPSQQTLAESLKGCMNSFLSCMPATLEIHICARPSYRCVLGVNAHAHALQHLR